MNEHPDYLYPTLQEAICEIAFKGPEALSSEEVILSYFSECKSEFPLLLPMENRPSVSPTWNASIYYSPFRYGVRYKKAERDVAIFLGALNTGEYRIGVSQLPRYEGWKTLRSDLERCLKFAATPKLDFTPRQIAVRFINRIPRNDANDRVSHWIAPCKYISAAIAHGTQPVQSTCVISNEDTGTWQVSLNVNQPSEVDGVGPAPMIIDLLRMSTVPEGQTVEHILSTADALHEDIWQIFNGMRTDNLMQLLNGEQI